MSDKIQKIKEEIERRIDEYKEYSQINYLTESTRTVNHARLLELCELKDFIDSQEEHASENLEEEINHISKNEYFNFSDWKSIARHFAEWQKQQMMKNAVKTIMQYDECDDLVPTLTDMSKRGFKKSEKVYVIIIKEDNQ